MTAFMLALLLLILDEGCPQAYTWLPSKTPTLVKGGKANEMGGNSTFHVWGDRTQAAPLMMVGRSLQRSQEVRLLPPATKGWAAAAGTSQTLVGDLALESPA